MLLQENTEMRVQAVQMVRNDGIDFEDRTDSGLAEGGDVKYKMEKRQTYGFRLDG